MVKLIIFDWDDVISIGSKEAYYSCYNQAAISVGKQFDEQELRNRINRKWGRPHKQEVAELLKENPELVDKATEVYEKCIFTDIFLRHLSLIPGSMESLVELSKNYKLALATGVHPKLLPIVMNKFGVDPNLFVQIVTSYDLADKNRGKPYPDMAVQIMQTQQVKPEETIIVGDAEGDVVMAQSAGVKPVVVLTGRLTEKQANKLGVEYIIKDITQLTGLLKLL